MVKTHQESEVNSVTLSGIEKAPEATWPSFLFLRKVMPKVTQRERKVCVGGWEAVLGLLIVNPVSFLIWKIFSN